MPHFRHPLAAQGAALVTAATLALLSGCAQPPRSDVHASVRIDAPVRVWTPPPPPPAISIYVEPPLVQPEPVLVNVAPPPMLVESPPPPPMPEAVWVGGYWGWQGQWVWCAGRWLSPPQAGYRWVQPYYENRDGAVIFVGGHWAATGVTFVPPPPGLHLSLQVSIGGGQPPVGPAGVFVPPPPGSRPGLIIPAPIGTPPAVVVSAPPVVNVGMRITNNITRNTTINNISNVTNITNVTVLAPPGATANGQAYQRDIPAQAHLAAALPPVVHAQAPRPTSTTPVSMYTPQQPTPTLPPAQPVRMEAASPRPAGAVPAPAGPTSAPMAHATEPHATPLARGAEALPAAKPFQDGPSVNPAPAMHLPRTQQAEERRPDAPVHAAEPRPQGAHPSGAKPDTAHHEAPGPRREPPPPAADKHGTPPPPASKPDAAVKQADEGRSTHKTGHKDEERHERRNEEAR